MKLEHAAFRDIEVQDDCLQFGGMPLTRLAQRVGSTPFYAYDRQAITRRVALLRQHLPKEIYIHYAIKANPMPAVVQHLATLVDGFDVASAGELRTALDTPMDPAAISFAGPAKGENELSCAVASGVVVNIESEQELERIARVGTRLRIRPKIAIRVNPDFELKSSGMKMGGGPKQFGIDAERVPKVLAQVGALDVDFQGFHIYSGSQNLNASAIQDAHEKTFMLAKELATHAPCRLRTL
ncbi:MAG: alanine racemase, partial [Burkholderiaceae bacterium]